MGFEPRSGLYLHTQPVSPVTISQKPLDTGYKGLDIYVECPWPADLIVLSLQTPKFVCRQSLIGAFLTEMLPDSRSYRVLFGIQSSEDPTWLGVAPDEDQPLRLCSSQAPGLDQCREGSSNLRGSVPPVFISLFSRSSPHAGTVRT